MIPTGELRVEAAAVNPPKPLGCHVIVAGHSIAVLTVDSVLQTADQLFDMAAARRKGDAVQGSEVKRIREQIGAAIGRRVSQRDLGLALGLSADNADRLVRKWEDGEPSGPAAVALELMVHCIDRGDVEAVRKIMERAR